MLTDWMPFMKMFKVKDLFLQIVHKLWTTSQLSEINQMYQILLQTQQLLSISRANSWSDDIFSIFPLHWASYHDKYCSL